MSTLSSANVTDVNLVLKERTHMRLCINMLIFTHNLGNWLIYQERLTSWLFISSLMGGATSVPGKTASMTWLSAEHDMTEWMLKWDEARSCLSVWLFHKHHDSFLCWDNLCQSRLNTGTRKLLSLASKTYARNNSTPSSMSPWSSYITHSIIIDREFVTSAKKKFANFNEFSEI